MSDLLALCAESEREKRKEKARDGLRTNIFKIVNEMDYEDTVIVDDLLKLSAESGREREEEKAKARLKIKIFKIISEMDYDDTIITHKILVNRGQVQKVFALLKMLSKLF